MKKLLALLIALMLCATAFAEAPAMAGGWETEMGTRTDTRAQSAFEIATAKLTGCSYEYVACLGTQVVAGINYCLLTRIAPIYPGATAHYSFMYVYADLSGDANVTDIVDIFNDENGENLAGGWYVPEAGITDEMNAAFTKAVEGTLGCNFELIACLGTQVVAGLNYRFFVSATPVYPGAEASYAVMTVYAALDGSAIITNIQELNVFDPYAQDEMTEEDGQNPAMNLVGYYQDKTSQRAHMFIDCLGMDSASVEIRWANSAFETVVWTFTGICDENDLSIEYTDCAQNVEQYADDGSVTVINVYENGTGRLTVDSDWSILWQDDVENAGEGCVFEYDSNYGE